MLSLSLIFTGETWKILFRVHFMLSIHFGSIYRFCIFRVYEDCLMAWEHGKNKWIQTTVLNPSADHERNFETNTNVAQINMEDHGGFLLGYPKPSVSREWPVQLGFEHATTSLETLGRPSPVWFPCNEQMQFKMFVVHRVLWWFTLAYGISLILYDISHQFIPVCGYIGGVREQITAINIRKLWETVNLGLVFELFSFMPITQQKTEPCEVHVFCIENMYVLMLGCYCSKETHYHVFQIWYSTHRKCVSHFQAAVHKFTICSLPEMGLSVVVAVIMREHLICQTAFSAVHDSSTDLKLRCKMVSIRAGCLNLGLNSTTAASLYSSHSFGHITANEGFFLQHDMIV